MIEERILSASFAPIGDPSRRPVRPPRTSRAAQAARYLLLLAAAAGAITVASASAKSSDVSERRGLETRLMEAVSQVRAEHGRVSLRFNPGLAAAAREHSTEMIEDGYFAHDGAQLSYARRLATYYPRSRGRRGWRIGEILAWGSPTLSAGEAITLWLRSPEHRATLLEGGWRDIGISAMHSRAAPGVFQGLDVTAITIDFGTR